MKYLIGLDGGGTKTHAVITNLNGEKLYECNGGASNFLVQGTFTVSQTLLSIIQKCVDEISAQLIEVECVLLGTTGAGRRNDAEKLENDFTSFLKEKNVSLKLFVVESDARIALEGAFAGKPGSILIAGTGSIMFGKDAQGNVYRVGGFGRFLGDEGSGYMLGKKGLVAVSKNFDGRGEATLLTNLVKEKFGIETPEILITEIYKNNFDIASIAPLVIEAAQKGDAAALKIVEEETNELLLHIKTMYNKMNEEALNVSFIGGLISSQNFYSNLFKKKIADQLPHVKVIEPIYPPAMGAVLMAKEKISK
jgi:N-acetylglucosamine kinase-like BadF-type ATPase